jgi:hypothetical protein
MAPECLLMTNTVEKVSDPTRKSSTRFCSDVISSLNVGAAVIGIVICSDSSAKKTFAYPLRNRFTTAHPADAACVEGVGDPVDYFISGDAIPTGMGGRGISLVRGGGSTPTTGRGWMSTGATGLDWAAGGD